MLLNDRYDYNDIEGYFGTDVANNCQQRTTTPYAKINFIFGSNFTLRNGNKTASVISLALLSDPTQHVKYEIKWNSFESAPAGNHLNQNNRDLVGRFVEDKDQNGEIITNKEGYLFDDQAFCFLDEIQQPNLTGTWTFRILVLNEMNVVLAEDSIELNWDSMNFPEEP